MQSRPGTARRCCGAHRSGGFHDARHGPSAISGREGFYGCRMACNPYSSIRIPSSLRRPTAHHRKRSMCRLCTDRVLRGPRGPQPFNYHGAPSSPASLGRSPKRPKRMQMAIQSHRMIPTGRPMRPARARPILRRNPAKRKRILCRRFLVSLGVKKKEPDQVKPKPEKGDSP